MIRPRKCLRAEARLLDILLEPWEGYRSPPVPEGTDATQIPVLKSASKWRDYDPSLHYVNCSRGPKSKIWRGDTKGTRRMWSHPLLLPTPGTSEHRGDLQEPRRPL